MKNLLIIFISLLIFTSTQAQPVTKSVHVLLENSLKSAEKDKKKIEQATVTISKEVSKASDQLINSVKENLSELDTNSNFKRIYSDLQICGVKITHSLSNILDSLSTTLKVGINEVWDIIVRQQRVYALTYLIPLILAMFFFVKFMNQLRGEDNFVDDSGSPTLFGTFSVIRGTLAFITLIIGFYHIDIILMGLLNPKYGALETISTFIKNH